MFKLSFKLKVNLKNSLHPTPNTFKKQNSRYNLIQVSFLMEHNYGLMENN